MYCLSNFKADLSWTIRLVGIYGFVLLCNNLRSLKDSEGLGRQRQAANGRSGSAGAVDGRRRETPPTHHVLSHTAVVRILSCTYDHVINESWEGKISNSNLYLFGLLFRLRIGHCLRPPRCQYIS